MIPPKRPPMVVLTSSGVSESSFYAALHLLYAEIIEYYDFAPILSDLFIDEFDSLI
jgi:hypothetical protein